MCVVTSDEEGAVARETKNKRIIYIYTSAYMYYVSLYNIHTYTHIFIDIYIIQYMQRIDAPLHLHTWASLIPGLNFPNENAPIIKV